MPNYYIQARRSTFNPFSFDEYVKPLNMYKEYYEKNEEAITDMQAQANLWKNIMESEKDSKLADKYKTYVNNLNDATQQLKNGMSYNLRNQIQQLRGQSAMVKQIENAYNLRAKDIDAYNELMIKDPSRIGADDPTTRSLNDYLNGPVKNNYGVSGDDLYNRAAKIGEAFSARNRSNPKYTDLGNGLYQTVEKAGYNNNDIAIMLNDPNSELNQQVNKMLSDINIPMSDNALQQARQTILQGMISGIKYDQDISYNRYTAPKDNPTGKDYTVDDKGNITGFDSRDWVKEHASTSGFTIYTGKPGSAKEHTGEKIVQRRDGSFRELKRNGDLYFDGDDYYIMQNDNNKEVTYTNVSAEDKKFFEEFDINFDEDGALAKYKEVINGFINNNSVKPYQLGDGYGQISLPKDPSKESFNRFKTPTGRFKEPLDPKYLTCFEYKISDNKTIYLVKLEDATGGAVYKVDKKTYDVYKKYKEDNTQTGNVTQTPKPQEQKPQQQDSTKTDTTSVKPGDVWNI